MKKLLQHPWTLRARRAVKIAVVIFAVIVAAAAVTSVTVDLGPMLRARAERAGTDYLKRPMHIGRLSVRLWNGKFRVEDLVIEGRTPQSRPWLTAREIDVSMPWGTLFNRRVVFDDLSRPPTCGLGSN